MRFSKFNRKATVDGISRVLDARNYNYIEAMKIAIHEDAVAYYQKLHKGKNYQYKDLKPNEADPE